MFGPPFAPSVARGVDQSLCVVSIAMIDTGTPAPLPFMCFSFSFSARALQVSGCSPSFATEAEGVGQSRSFVHVVTYFANSPPEPWCPVASIPAMPCGVGQSFSATHAFAAAFRCSCGRPARRRATDWFADLESSTVGVGQEPDDEEALALVSCPDVRSSENSRRNAVAQDLKVFRDLLEAEREVARDVFEEHHGSSHLAQDTGNLWPQVARVVRSQSLAGEAEWLARITCRDDIHDATPRSAIEGCEIVPNREAR
jgi:hypothetical protein